MSFLHETDRQLFDSTHWLNGIFSAVNIFETTVPATKQACKGSINSSVILLIHADYGPFVCVQLRTNESASSMISIQPSQVLDKLLKRWQFKEATACPHHFFLPVLSFMALKRFLHAFFHSRYKCMLHVTMGKYLSVM